MVHFRHSALWARIIFAVVMLVSFCAPMVVAARVFSIEIVSVASDGTQANLPANNPASSADGRYVAFHSPASNLVAGDTNGEDDIFVHDRSSGTTSRVSVASDGTQGNDYSRFPDLSADGRYVAFQSQSSNLVAGDTNGVDDIFVHDRSTGQTTRVSVASDGTQGNASSNTPDLSADGRYVAFWSSASNLVAGDTNGQQDIFVHDRSTGQTTRVSVASDSTQGNASSNTPDLSADGRYVAFRSFASNLVAGDTNGWEDIFVHDRSTGQTARVSVSSAGVQANNFSQDPAISGDGRFVAFASAASNLVAGDTNGAIDVFVHDRATGETRLASTNLAEVSSNDTSDQAAISEDGAYVFFRSGANNLVSGDTNGFSDIFAVRVAAFTDTVGVFRPSVATFFLRNTNDGGLADIIQSFGSSTDVPLVGDWDGDGSSTIGLYRADTRSFYLNDQNTDGTPEITTVYIAPRGVPVVGDWDGNGTETLGIYNDGVFLLSNSTTSGFPEIFIYFGDSALDRPLAGDWDGDGRDTVGLWRASTASFFLTNVSASGFGTADIMVNYGISTDVPFIGDWDADGIDGIGVYRPSNGDVYLRNALTSGLPDILFNYGIAQDIPLAGVWQVFAAPDQANDGGTSAPVFVPKQ